jgi:hypothetical protein
MAQHVLIVDDDASRHRSNAQDLRRLAVEEVAAPVRARERAAATCRVAFDLIVQELHAPATGESAAAMQRGNPPRQRGS